MQDNDHHTSGNVADLEDISSSKSIDSSESPAQTPLLKRVENLELSMRSLEERCSPRSVVDWSSASGRSSCLSTPSSAVEKRRKPIDDVLEETEEKGTLVERVATLEQRLETLTVQLGKGDWTPTSQVPVLNTPPAKVSRNVAEGAPSDLPAVEEKHGVNGLQEGDHAAFNHKLKKRHTKIPHMFKNCLHPVSSN